jgi:hypothetical protein
MRRLILRQLVHQVGLLPERLVAQVTALKSEKLEDLAEALLDFEAVSDLETWLDKE